MFVRLEELKSQQTEVNSLVSDNKFSRSNKFSRANLTDIVQMCAELRDMRQEDVAEDVVTKLFADLDKIDGLNARRRDDVTDIQDAVVNFTQLANSTNDKVRILLA